jgi:hypothetical protein
MKITKKRIRNVATNFPFLQEGSTVVFGLQDLSSHSARLHQAGLSPGFPAGESVLPTVMKSVSRYNAEGRYVRQQPPEKETVSRMIEWTWTERHGKDEVERSDFKYVPYERYKRVFLPPPGIELTIATDSKTGQRLLVTPPIQYAGAATDAQVIHRVNLLLELFGESEVMTEDFDQIIRAEVRRLNWQVLPAGKRDWPTLQQELEPLVERQKPGLQGVIRRRFAYVNSFEPSFVAIGQAGFSGYVIFGFPQKGVYVLESVHTNNATYVFEQDWEALSQMTKTDILSQQLQRDRVFHTNGWTEQVARILR